MGDCHKKEINPMIKRILYVFLCGVLCLSMAACGGNAKDESTSSGDPQVAYKEVRLTEEEKSILEAMGSDVNVITDEDYMKTVSEMIYHTAGFAGAVYQMEGVFTFDGENASVYRTLVNGEQTQVLGLPLNCLEKEIDNGAWVRVTGIVAEGETNGEPATVLDVVAIEALPVCGQATLQWDGSSVHQH